MLKKHLLPLFASAILALPVCAQETSAGQVVSAPSEARVNASSMPGNILLSGKPAVADGSKERLDSVQDANGNPKGQAASSNESPTEENAILRAIKAVGSAYASGTVKETDEFAEDWAAAQNPDVVLREQASDHAVSQPQGENILLKIIKAIGSAYASGKLVENDEFADSDEMQEPIETPTVAAPAVLPAPIGTAEPGQLDDKASAIPSGTSEPGMAIQAVPGGQPETGAIQPAVPVSGNMSEAVVMKQGKQEKTETAHTVKPLEQQAVPAVGTKRSFPEVMVSTWQDQLPKDTPVSEISEKALAGDPEAQYRLGMACYLGKDVRKDDGKAFQWWQESAEKGYPKAMHIMGVAYRRGIGVLKHAQKALDWFIKAAQQGRAIDQYIVADAYYEAKVNNMRDDILAIYWATHAARQGHPGALILLAQAKMEGRGVPPNIIHAYVLAQKAVEFDRDADTVAEEIEKNLPDEQQEIAKTVTLEDALKPTPLAALLIKKTPEGETIQPSTSQAGGLVVEPSRTDNPIGGADHD